jgi:hypothetical protein
MEKGDLVTLFAFFRPHSTLTRQHFNRAIRPWPTCRARSTATCLKPISIDATSPEDG